jgi:phosphatidate cytidylyltransferase
MDKLAKPRSDLGVRTASAVVMVAVAGIALWLGGWWWIVFIALIAAGLFIEWGWLAKSAWTNWWSIALALIIGWVIIILGCISALETREYQGLAKSLFFVLAVVCVDVGAYFFGRSIGGPKIAPQISPSKTWAGLIGGGVCAAAFMVASSLYFYPGWRVSDTGPEYPMTLVFLGFLAAVIAQSGDFAESWVKRKAGVKDSSALIPGHGGLLDRADGMLAIFFAKYIAEMFV